MTMWIDVDEIRYSQNSISRTFSNGQSIRDAIEGLRDGWLIPDDFPRIHVFWDDDLYAHVSKNNRRL